MVMVEIIGYFCYNMHTFLYSILNTLFYFYFYRAANLLGVVGADVPIEEIQKMIPQHKLGANGYSFIIDNNGHVLYHPGLKPLNDNDQYSQTLKHKYNLIDLMELELPESEFANTHNNNINNQEKQANLLMEVKFLNFYSIHIVSRIYLCHLPI